MNMKGRCPKRSSSMGKAPQTSARPPVLANGTTSLLAIKIFTGCLPCSKRCTTSCSHQPELSRPLLGQRMAFRFKPFSGLHAKTREYLANSKVRSPTLAYSQSRFSGPGAVCEGPIVFRFKDCPAASLFPNSTDGLLGLTSNFSRVAKSLHQLEWNHMCHGTYTGEGVNLSSEHITNTNPL